MKRVIVTGASGFIGSHLLNHLIYHGVHVYALIRESSVLGVAPSPFLTVLNCSLDKLSEIRDCFERDIDVFYHLAWSGANGPKRLDYELQLNNIYSSIKCLEFAEELGCKKFITTGTITENLIEQIPYLVNVSENLLYGLAKMTSHNMLKIISNKLKIDIVWAQLANVYGPNDSTDNLINYTISKLTKDELAEFTSGDLVFDFVYIDDVIAALMLLGERFTNLNKYFIGSGEPRLLRDFLISIGETMNKVNLIGLGVKPDSLLKYDLSWFNIYNLKQETGFYPTSNFEQNIRKLLKSN